MIITDEKNLRQKSELATFEEAIQIIQQLEKELENKGIGLAAPQIGILKQVAIIRYNNFKINIINPKDIQYLDGNFVFKNEGCLSFPGIRKNTLRSQSIQFTSNDNECYYYSINEGPNKESTDPYLIVSCQHELEHLKGELFIDHALKPEVSDSKINRNDSCPCGSGKKYKKCCLSK